MADDVTDDVVMEALKSAVNRLTVVQVAQVLRDCYNDEEVEELLSQIDLLDSDDDEEADI